MPPPGILYVNHFREKIDNILFSSLNTVQGHTWRWYAGNVENAENTGRCESPGPMWKLIRID